MAVYIFDSCLVNDKEGITPYATTRACKKSQSTCHNLPEQGWEQSHVVLSQSDHWVIMQDAMCQPLKNKKWRWAHVHQEERIIFCKTFYLFELLYCAPATVLLCEHTRNGDVVKFTFCLWTLINNYSICLCIQIKSFFFQSIGFVVNTITIKDGVIEFYYSFTWYNIL